MRYMTLRASKMIFQDLNPVAFPEKKGEIVLLSSKKEERRKISWESFCSSS